MRKYFKKIIDIVTNDYIFNVLNYNYLRMKSGYLPRFPNFHYPKTFNEKIVFLKLYHRYPNAHLLADKYAVRSFVKTRVGSSILFPPLYGVFSDPEKIDFDLLPDQFVLKPNHASGLIKFCRKDKFDRSTIIPLMKKWLSIDYGKIGREYQYRDIDRKIVVEKDMRIEAGTDQLTDYKFFCFNGYPRFIQVDLDRYKNHTRNFYDTEWKRLPFSLLFPNSKKDVPPPSALQDMIQIAKKLSQGMIFARIDLYEVNSYVYFGEITFHPGGGMEPFVPDHYDRIIGDYLQLP